MFFFKSSNFSKILMFSTAFACLSFYSVGAMAQQDVQPSKVMPDAAALSDVKKEAPQNPPAANDSMSPAAVKAAPVDKNLFFDAEFYARPNGEQSNGGVRKVDPSVDKGSKLVVVEKNRSAGSFEAGLVSAERAMKLGRYDSALMIYEDLYKRNKRNPNVLLGRATAYQHMGDAGSAIASYEELLKVKPKNLVARVNMLSLSGQAYPEVSLQELLKLQKKHTGNVDIIAQIASMYGRMEQYPEALKYLGVAASLDPHNAGHVYNIAVVADKSGRKSEAIKYYEKALEVDAVYGASRSIPREVVVSRLTQLR